MDQQIVETIPTVAGFLSIKAWEHFIFEKPIGPRRPQDTSNGIRDTFSELIEMFLKQRKDTLPKRLFGSGCANIGS